MGLVKSGFAVFFLALAVLCVGAPSAKAQMFTFEVCNRSNVSASVAVSNRVAPGDARFEVQGWWTVAAGNCENLGDFVQGWFYIYAEQTNSGRIVWEGDFPLCIQYPGPFDVVHASGITCSSNLLKQFTAEQIPSTTGTFTYTLN
jgi:uncharacterized membrane protein